MHTYLEVPGIQIDKARLRRTLRLQIIVDNGKCPPKLLSPFDEKLAPFMHCRVFRHGDVITLHPRRSFVTLDPAAWLADAESLCEQVIPVVNTSVQESHMYVVERVGGERPWKRAIINFATRQVQACKFHLELGMGFTGR